MKGVTVGGLERPASANHTAAVRKCGLLDPGCADLGGTRHGSPAQSNHNRKHENKLLRIAVSLRSLAACSKICGEMFDLSSIISCFFFFFFVKNSTRRLSALVSPNGGGRQLPELEASRLEATGVLSSRG